MSIDNDDQQAQRLREIDNLLAECQRHDMTGVRVSYAQLRALRDAIAVHVPPAAVAGVPDEVARDAARYRFLRTKAETGSVRTLLPLYKSHFIVVNESAHDYPDLDDAVDAMLAAAQAQEGEV